MFPAANHDWELMVIQNRINLTDMSTLIYHMTHIANVESILREGRIYCDAVAERLLRPRSIAYGHLKAWRASKQVPVPPYGTLADYVPFYFAPRSPMLFAIQRGYVNSSLAQHEIVYIVSTVEMVQQHGKPFVFTDGHPLSEITCFSNNLAELDEFVDWEVMRSPYWYDCAEYPDRKRKRQAEFLVHAELECALIVRIGVYNPRIQQEVAEIVRKISPHPIPVEAHRDWYY